MLERDSLHAHNKPHSQAEAYLVWAIFFSIRQKLFVYCANFVFSIIVLLGKQIMSVAILDRLFQGKYLRGQNNVCE